MNNENNLNNWDIKLLKKHLEFYLGLESGKISIDEDGDKVDKIKRKHFTDVLNNKQSPKTQHEIAFSKWIKAGRPNLSNQDLKIDENDKIFEVKSYETIDEIDKIIFNPDQDSYISSFAKKIQDFYNSSMNTVLNASNLRKAEALSWSYFFTESYLSKGLERLSADSFNNLSNVYTKAIDGLFAEGLKSGADYISPTLHRMMIEGHTIQSAITKVKEALPDDTKWQEAYGVVSSLASDMSSVIGLPISVLGKENTEKISQFLGNIGISESKFADLWSQNLVELVGSSIPILATVLCWNTKDTKKFSEMVGMMGITSIYAGNPIGLIVTLVALARSFHLDKQKEISSLDWAYSLGKGGIISTISIVLMGILGPAIWVSLITFIIVVVLFSKSGAIINWNAIGKSFYEFIVGYLPTYSKV